MMQVSYTKPRFYACFLFGWHVFCCRNLAGTETFSNNPKLCLSSVNEYKTSNSLLQIITLPQLLHLSFRNNYIRMYLYFIEVSSYGFTFKRNSGALNLVLQEKTNLV